jgi:hypothetical protein
MGLDQYAWALDQRPEKDVDFAFSIDPHLPPFSDNSKSPFQEDPVFGSLFRLREGCGIAALAYWRKHPNLHGFIEEIYRRKGGKDFQWDQFSGPVVLDREDIDAIEQATTKGELPFTQGFFFGQSEREYHDPLTLEFCKRARAAIEAGKTVIYDSSW